MTLPAHWSQVDPGPLTDDERHARVTRLHDELTRAREWRDRLVAAADHDVALLEQSLRRELSRPASNPTRKDQR